MPQAADISKLEAQWHAFFPRRDRDLIAGIWAEVRDKYSEPQRFYHHLGHLVSNSRRAIKPSNHRDLLVAFS
jgi:hypothetical protein